MDNEDPVSSGSPLFLHLNAETDSAYLISTKANVNASSTELRQQLYKDGSDISAVMEDGDASWNSMLGAEMNRNEFSMDSFLHDDRSSILRRELDQAVSEIYYFSDGESEYDSVIRNSWSSVDHPPSPALSPVELSSDDSFHSFKNDSERNDLEEHFSREGLSWSPLLIEDEDFYFGENGEQYKQKENENYSGLDLHEYLLSTSGEVQNPAVVNGGMSVLGVEQPLEVDNVNLSSVSIVDEYFKQMQLDDDA
uniref:Uncharacterized protein n=1 Tax=Trichuris muris TaxID=70415 RepID=A0A5S6QBL6_TRIMR